MTFRKCFFLVVKVGVFVILAFIAWVIYYFNFVVTGPRGQTPFAVAHKRAVKTFVEGKNFGIHRFRKVEDFHEYSFIIDEEEWYLDEMSLVGASQEYGERYYEGGRRQISKGRLGKVGHRPLTTLETEALRELRAKRPDFVPLKEKEEEEVGTFVKRVMAEIPAQTSCLKCHDAGEGELLGAFVYSIRRK